MSSSSCIWNKLKHCESSCYILCNENDNSLFSIQAKPFKLSKYDNISNKWIQYKLEHSNDDAHNYLPCGYELKDIVVTIDHIQCKIIIINKQFIIILTINNSNKTFDEQVMHLEDEFGIESGIYAQAIFYDDQFHFIGGIQNKHIEFDPYNSNKDLTIISNNFALNSLKFHQYQEHLLMEHRLLKMPNSKIILFGGKTPDFLRDEINTFDTKKNSWQTSNHFRLPKPLSDFAITSVLDNSFIIFFGGNTTECYDNEYSDDIFIYSLNDKIFTTSKIKCPQQIISPQAYSINDRKKDHLIIFGSVRDIWKKFKIADSLFPPEYLIKIICLYYWNEFIHLFGVNCHYNIDIFQLLL